MNRSWNPPTPLDMECPHCGRTIPRGTVRHGCTDQRGHAIPQNILIVRQGKGHENRTVRPPKPTPISEAKPFLDYANPLWRPR